MRVRKTVELRRMQDEGVLEVNGKNVRIKANK